MCATCHYLVTGWGWGSDWHRRLRRHREGQCPVFSDTEIVSSVTTINTITYSDLPHLNLTHLTDAFYSLLHTFCSVHHCSLRINVYASKMFNHIAGKNVSASKINARKTPQECKCIVRNELNSSVLLRLFLCTLMLSYLSRGLKYSGPKTVFCLLA